MEATRLHILAGNAPSLEFLIDPRTGQWWARSHLAENPTLQAGHQVTHYSGAPERFSLEDAFFNQVTNWTGETGRKAIALRPVVDIEGVAVDYRTAQQWKRMGRLRNVTLPDAEAASDWITRRRHELLGW